MNKNKFIKNLQLGISACIVIIVGFIYGFDSGRVLPEIFGFKVESLELKNIFRAIMGLYLAFGSFWIIGIAKPIYWRTATLTNIIFMGGLAFGRVISTLIDGISFQFSMALMLEVLLMLWGIYNFKKK